MYSVIDEAGEDYILDFLYDKYSVLLLIYQVYLALKYDTWLPSFLSKPSTLGVQEHAVLKEIVDFSFG